MADILSSCTVEPGDGNQEILRVPQWHTYRVTVPSGTLATSGTDDLLLPGRYESDVQCYDAFVQVTDVVTIGTSCTVDLESALRAISGGALSSVVNAVAAVDCETLETSFASSADHVVLGSFGTGVTAGTNERVFNLEFSPTGTQTGDLVLVVGALLGRVTY